MATNNTAANISTGTCFPFALDLIAVNTTVVLGSRSELGTLATYLGITLDGLAVVRVLGSKINHGCGVGVEEWPAEFVRSLAEAAAA